MPGWPLAAAMVVAVVAVGLSGCAGSPADAAADAGDAPSVITDPRDLRNGTAPGSHIHDYWGGRDRVPVLQEDGEVWSQCSGACSGGMSGAWRRPREGAIVPQGTRWVNGTFHFTPSAENTVASYELWVKTALDKETKRWGELVPGQPFSIATTREANDPPHYVLSLWQFEVLGKGSGSDVSFRGAFRWSVEAVRGLPLEPYPPHPDRWNGQESLPVLSGTGAALLYYESDGARVCYFGVEGCPGQRHTPADGVVVPFDAARVEVRLAGNVAGLGLVAHGADTWEFHRVAGTLQGSDLVFDIPIQGSMADSPYAPQSLWEFVVDTDEPLPLEAWAGAYTITVTAHR